jgi:hypothetical protein
VLPLHDAQLDYGNEARSVSLALRLVFREEPFLAGMFRGTPVANVVRQ